VTVKTFGLGCLAVLVLLLGYGGYLVVNRWVYATVGDRYEVRRNRFTGRVEVKDQGQWRQTTDPRPLGDALSEDDLRRVRLTDLAWSRSGFLCGTATVAPGGGPLSGRLAFQMVVVGSNGKRRLIESERNLRYRVDWEPGRPTPFALYTEFRPPESGERSFITLVPVLLDAAGAAPGSGRLPTASAPSPYDRP
jgi:hypothetical protein